MEKAFSLAVRCSHGGRPSAAVAKVGLDDSVSAGLYGLTMPMLAAIDRHVRFFIGDSADVHPVGPAHRLWEVEWRHRSSVAGPTFSRTRRE